MYKAAWLLIQRQFCRLPATGYRLPEIHEYLIKVSLYRDKNVVGVACCNDDDR
jgi:hypothetical protein